MRKKKTQHLGHFALVSSVMGALCLLVLGTQLPSHPSDIQEWGSFGANAVSANIDDERIADPEIARVASRLQRRVRRTFLASPSLPVLARAIQQRRALLQRKLIVSFTAENTEDSIEWEVSLHEYPQWIEAMFTGTDARFEVNRERVLSHLRDRSIGIRYPRDIVIVGLEEDEVGLHALTDANAEQGYVFNEVTAATIIEQALKTGASNKITVPLIERPGSIANATDMELGKLSLLATGRSNFAGSPWARIQNVRKGLREHLNNVVVLPGDTFSFNEIIEPPITISRGWHMAKVIFEGGELRPAPGGGICQVSTTLYRAVLRAGFPVEDRRNHSLYVSYYEKYGVGMDATVYPGDQDFIFVNDTAYPILIQAYDEGDDAIVNIYGSPDGRQVEVEGPYFSTTTPPDFSETIGIRDIAWTQRIIHSDGAEQENVIISRYKALPKNLRAKYAVPEKISIALR